MPSATADGHDQGVAGKFHRVEVTQELVFHEDHADLGVVEDVPHLRWGQTPVDCHRDSVDLCRAIGECEVFRDVLGDDPDPVLVLDPGSEEGVRNE